MRSLVALFVGLSTLAGCKDFGSLANNGLSANTQRSSYTTSDNITFIVSNAGSQTVILASCCIEPAFYVDRYENAAWTESEGHGIPCLALCPGRPYSFSAQSQFVDSIRIQQPGTYRFRFPYGFASTEAMTYEFPSNQFTVQ